MNNTHQLQTDQRTATHYGIISRRGEKGHSFTQQICFLVLPVRKIAINCHVFKKGKKKITFFHSQSC